MKKSILLKLITFGLSTLFLQNTYAEAVQTLQNHFVEQNIATQEEVSAKLEQTFNEIFYGVDSNNSIQNADSIRIYYPLNESGDIIQGRPENVSCDTAYIKYHANNDIRSEGVGYGLIIAVMMDKRAEFDCLWKWARNNMQHRPNSENPQLRNGEYGGYFAWQVRDTGEVLDLNPASDGDEWIVTALLFAAERWADTPNSNLIDYNQEAQHILNSMLNKNGGTDIVYNMFADNHLITFVPYGEAASFTNPSYQTPHFYQIWANKAQANNSFWQQATNASRDFFPQVMTTSPDKLLPPNYSTFQGTTDFSNLQYFTVAEEHKNFSSDAWRVAMNMSVDYAWSKDSLTTQYKDWLFNTTERLLTHFDNNRCSNQYNQYPSLYALDGTVISDQDFQPQSQCSTNSRVYYGQLGLKAMNAVAAAMASNYSNRKTFIQELWDIDLTTYWQYQGSEGRSYRYYHNLLHMLAMLQVSGEFKAYTSDSTGGPQPTTTVNITSFEVNEGQSAVLPITLSQTSSSNTVITYEITQAGQLITSSTATIAANETQTQDTYSANEDENTENESLTITITDITSGNEGIQIGTSTATITVKDNDRKKGGGSKKDNSNTDTKGNKGRKK